jgi:hypothetical protein
MKQAREQLSPSIEVLESKNPVALNLAFLEDEVSLEKFRTRQRLLSAEVVAL